MNPNDIIKVKCIMRTLLLTQGPKTAKQLLEFINFNGFKLNTNGVSYQNITSLVRSDRACLGILKDVEVTETSPVKYYIPKLED